MKDPNGINEEQLKERAAYLAKQRDTLMELKRIEREKKFNVIIFCK